MLLFCNSMLDFVCLIKQSKKMGENQWLSCFCFFLFFSFLKYFWSWIIPELGWLMCYILHYPNVHTQTLRPALSPSPCLTPRCTVISPPHFLPLYLWPVVFVVEPRPTPPSWRTWCSYWSGGSLATWLSWTYYNHANYYKASQAM